MITTSLRAKFPLTQKTGTNTIFKIPKRPVIYWIGVENLIEYCFSKSEPKETLGFDSRFKAWGSF